MSARSQEPFLLSALCVGPLTHGCFPPLILRIPKRQSQGLLNKKRLGHQLEHGHALKTLEEYSHRSPAGHPKGPNKSSGSTYCVLRAKSAHTDAAEPTPDRSCVETLLSRRSGLRPGHHHTGKAASGLTRLRFWGFTVGSNRSTPVPTVGMGSRGWAIW